jgi:hypothetical protein
MDPVLHVFRGAKAKCAQSVGCRPPAATACLQNLTTRARPDAVAGPVCGWAQGAADFGWRAPSRSGPLLQFQRWKTEVAQHWVSVRVEKQWESGRWMSVERMGRGGGAAAGRQASR